MGLDRMQELCRRLGVENGGTAKFVHVAGTNGKGSTVCLVESILRRRYSTGATYSPYVYSVRERITGPNGLISEKDFAEAAYEVCRVGADLEATDFGGPTEFEAKTAMAFLYWKLAGVEAVALETGLGGRLDATNIVRPAVSVITSIGLDHVDILGPTELDIAREKAGIIKPGVPVILGRMTGEIAEEICKVAQVTGSPVYSYDRLWNSIPDESWRNEAILMSGMGWSGQLPSSPYLRGPIQKINVATAILAVKVAFPEITDEEISAGVAEARLPGRFEVRRIQSRTWILDGAHNAQAARELAWSFLSEFGRTDAELIVGMLDGHDPEPVIEALAEIGNRIRLVPINWTRTRDPESLRAVAEKYFDDVQVYWSVAEAVDSVTSGVVLVTGSFYLLGEVAKELENQSKSEISGTPDSDSILE